MTRRIGPFPFLSKVKSFIATNLLVFNNTCMWMNMIKGESFRLTIGLILAAFVVFAPLFCEESIAEKLDLPIHIHLTWQYNNMSSTITVTWQTRDSDSGNTVAYDNVSRNSAPSLYRYSVIGTNHTYPGASGGIHDVELSGLKPNSTYYFVCGGEKGGYSDERSFRTAPIHSSHLRFVVGGDSRTNWSQRDNISRGMSKFNPSFVLFSGDLVTSGYNQTMWDSFFEGLHSYWIGSNSLTIPIIPCLGNHEQNATNYYEQFALPGNEQWYSLNWGKYVHITVLNSEADPSSAQLDWLENDLASHGNYAWKFVLFHQPPFSSGKHDSWTEGQEYWCPLFDKYHVDIVFAGHDHNYERSKPINYTASKTSPQDTYSKGTMYIISGGWGAPLYSNGSNWWTDYSSSIHHFVLVDIFTNGTLNLYAKDVSGSTFDEVIQKVPVIPEFPWNNILPILVVATLLAIVRKKLSSFYRGQTYSKYN